jgi:hypothetical protein
MYQKSTSAVNEVPLWVKDDIYDHNLASFTEKFHVKLQDAKRGHCHAQI